MVVLKSLFILVYIGPASGDGELAQPGVCVRGEGGGHSSSRDRHTHVIGRKWNPEPGSGVVGGWLNLF